MAEEYDFNIKKIAYSKGFGERDKKERRKKKKKQTLYAGEAKDHIGDLALAVERVNALLAKNKSSNRFSIVQKNNDIFIQCIILDEKGDRQKTIRENITHQEFLKIIEQIEKLDGFLVDYTV